MKLLGNRGKIQNSIIFEDVDLKIHDDVDDNILEDGDKEVDKMKSKANRTIRMWKNRKLYMYWSLEDRHMPGYVRSDDQENSRKCIAICKDDTDAGNETTDKAFTPGSEDNQSVMYRNKL